MLSWMEKSDVIGFAQSWGNFYKKIAWLRVYGKLRVIYEFNDHSL